MPARAFVCSIEIAPGDPAGRILHMTLDALAVGDLPVSAATPGSYTNLNATVDQYGRITSASNGTAGAGTVTSVGLTMPGGFTVTGSPVTTSGTFAVTITGDVSFGGTNRVTDLRDPGNPQDAATKAYVDAAFAGVGGPYQPLDSDLTAIAALITDSFGRGLLTQTSAANVRSYIGAGTGNGNGTVTSVTATQPSAGLTISGSPVTTSGTFLFALANDLAALEGITGTNVIAFRTGTDTWVGATLGSGLSYASGVLSASGISSLAAITDSVTQTAHGFAVGDLVRINGSGGYSKSQADSAAGAEVTGMVSAVANANQFTITFRGRVTIPGGSLLSGAVYFLSPTTAGGYTTTVPATTGQVNKPIFEALSSTDLILHNYRGTVVSNGANASPFVIVTGTAQTLVTGTRYIANNPTARVMFTLPASANPGEQVFVRGWESGGWRIGQNAGQVIRGNGSTTAGTGGYLESTNQRDTATLECIIGGASPNEWLIINQRGTLNSV